MWWRARGEDVRRAVKLRKQGSSDIWWVCDDYVLSEGEVVAAYPEFWLRHKGAFPGPSRSIEHWSCYKPLDDAPELFLEFARLSEAPDFDEAVLAFCRKYGVPGSAHASGAEYPHVTDLAGLARDSEEALRILKMYEAVINRDPAKADSLLREHYSAYFPPSEEDFAEWSKWDPEKEALECVTTEVEMTVQNLCLPYLEIEEAVKPPRIDPSKVDAGWLFNNLLGAAYLQMYWLMASANELRRCEYCGRLISLGRHHSRKRKSRNDKRFCDDACRQAHHRSMKKREVPGS